MLVERREQRLYADYNQFYVEDRDAAGDTGSLDFWTDEAFQNKVAVVPGTVGIGTATYGYVCVHTELHDASPSIDLAAWDHVTEAGLEITSGAVRVTGCLADEGEDFAVASGPHRVRCCHADLAEASGTDEGTDWYIVQIWPAPLAPPIVLKYYSAEDI